MDCLAYRRLTTRATPYDTELEAVKALIVPDYDGNIYTRNPGPVFLYHQLQAQRAAFLDAMGFIGEPGPCGP